jgi:hypothetical protein
MSDKDNYLDDPAIPIRIIKLDSKEFIFDILKGIDQKYSNTYTSV